MIAIRYECRRRLIDGSFDPQSPVASGSIKFTASGFPPNTQINYALSGAPGQINGSLTTDAQGALTQTLNAPNPYKPILDVMGQGVWSLDRNNAWTITNGAFTIALSAPSLVVG